MYQTFLPYHKSPNLQIFYIFLIFHQPTHQNSSEKIPKLLQTSLPTKTPNPEFIIINVLRNIRQSFRPRGKTH